jgi:16S rRNA G966 N2-methylase RsmD
MTAMSPIMAGDGCVGFILGRGISGVEAFDREAYSLGLFESEQAAAQAVLQAAEAERDAG